MSISIKKFNWKQRPSAYESAQAWRSHRRNMTAQFLNEGSVLSNAFLNATTNLSTGMATLAAQASITRAQQEIRAAQAEIAKSAQLDVSI